MTVAAAVAVTVPAAVRFGRVAALVLDRFALGRPGGPATVPKPRAAPPTTGPDPHTVLEAAYESYQRELYTFALRSTKDADAAADVVQEAFIRLLRELQERRPPDNVRAWLYRVASNLMINVARKVSALDRVRHILARPESTHESPERGALQRERDRAVAAALETLAPDARMGLLLAANGFSGREIAEAIGRSELATRSLMCRARLELRSRLEPFDPAAEQASGP